MDRGSGIGPVWAQAGPGLPGGTGGGSVALGAFNSVSGPLSGLLFRGDNFLGHELPLGSLSGIPRQDLCLANSLEVRAESISGGRRGRVCV